MGAGTKEHGALQAPRGGMGQARSRVPGRRGAVPCNARTLNAAGPDAVSLVGLPQRELAPRLVPASLLWCRGCRVPGRKVAQVKALCCAGAA